MGTQVVQHQGVAGLLGKGQHLSHAGVESSASMANYSSQAACLNEEWIVS